MNLVQITGALDEIPHPQEDIHVFETDADSFVLVADGSRVYSVDTGTAALLKDSSSPGDLAGLGLGSHERITDVGYFCPPPQKV